MEDTSIHSEERQGAPQDMEEARKAAHLKARRRRRRAFLALLGRFVMFAVVVYVLFYQVLGVISMPNGDMYPRIDSGDLVLFYRFDKDVRAQDVVVFEKEANALQEYVESNPVDEGEAQTAEPVDGAETTAVPTVAPAVTPAPDAPTPQQIVSDNSFKGKLNRLFYNAAAWLRLRQPEGKQLYVCRVVACEGDTVEVSREKGLVVNGNSMHETNIFSSTTEYVGFTEYPLTLGPGECFVMADRRNGGADSRFFGPVRKEEILGTVVTIARRNNL